MEYFNFIFVWYILKEFKNYIYILLDTGTNKLHRQGCITERRSFDKLQLYSHFTWYTRHFENGRNSTSIWFSGYRHV